MRVRLLTSWASAGGGSIGACEAGGVVEAGIVEQVTGVVRLLAQGPAEERRAGAGKLPGHVRLPTPASVQARRRVALVHVGAAVGAGPACGAETPPQRRATQESALYELIYMGSTNKHQNISQF